MGRSLTRSPIRQIMTLKLTDKWVWDFWFAQDGPDTHVFYLQAARSLKQEILRHWHVSIGHAVSQDLIHWEILPDALAPADDATAWDNYTTWTGSIIQHAEKWHLFYTGSNQAEKGLIQRIGLATSDDLITWERHPNNPLLQADPQWYETIDLDLWHDQAWRDPWVFEHQGQFHAYITARCNAGEKSGRGVIGHAVSPDLHQWEIRPPVTAPGHFGQMEVPQLIEIEGRWYLFFSTTHDTYAQQHLAKPGVKNHTGTHYLVGESPLGPFRYLTDEFMVGDAFGSLYSGKLIQNARGEWVFMAFRMFDAAGEFYGELIDPLPVRIASDGILRVNKK